MSASLVDVAEELWGKPVADVLAGVLAAVLDAEEPEVPEDPHRRSPCYQCHRQAVANLRASLLGTTEEARDD